MCRVCPRAVTYRAWVTLDACSVPLHWRTLSTNQGRPYPELNRMEEHARFIKITSVKKRVLSQVKWKPANLEHILSVTVSNRKIVLKVQQLLKFTHIATKILYHRAQREIGSPVLQSKARLLISLMHLLTGLEDTCKCFS